MLIFLDIPWTELYAPSRLEECLFSVSQLTELRGWVASWSKRPPPDAGDSTIASVSALPVPAPGARRFRKSLHSLRSSARLSQRPLDSLPPLSESIASASADLSEDSGGSWLTESDSRHSDTLQGSDVDWSAKDAGFCRNKSFSIFLLKFK